MSDVTKEQIDSAVLVLFQSYAEEKLSLAQFMIRIRKVKTKAIEAGIVVKN